MNSMMFYMKISWHGLEYVRILYSNYHANHRPAPRYAAAPLMRQPGVWQSSAKAKLCIATFSTRNGRLSL
jgi:hypothetical protein